MPKINRLPSNNMLCLYSPIFYCPPIIICFLPIAVSYSIPVCVCVRKKKYIKRLFPETILTYLLTVLQIWIRIRIFPESGSVSEVISGSGSVKKL